MVDSGRTVHEDKCLRKLYSGGEQRDPKRLLIKRPLDLVETRKSRKSRTAKESQKQGKEYKDFKNEKDLVGSISERVHTLRDIRLGGRQCRLGSFVGWFL